VTDNPVYIPPDAGRPLGDVYSTGGYHNAQACPAIDAVAFAHADLCQLAQRLTDHLFGHPEIGPLLGRDEWTIKPLHMAVNGWAEEARAAAHPTLLSLGAFGQNDVPSLSALAWAKADAIGRSLDAALAGLAVILSQTLHMQDRQPPAALAPMLRQVRAAVPPIDSPRPLGREVQQLAETYSHDASPSPPRTS
jgi:histidine ammonia-lyase